LDVGCGSGTITKGIAELVKEEGLVVGIDSSPHLIELARIIFKSIPNLIFKVEDIHSFQPEFQFDVISCARTLQWLFNPGEALSKMVKMLKRGGVITVLDYNHAMIEWLPEIPNTMKILYTDFLKWRSDAGMDNKIADNFEVIFKSLGLKNIDISIQDEYTTKEMEDAEGAFGIWTKVAETRGKQLVEDHYITEDLRLKAIDDYNHWVLNEAISMKLYMRAVTGTLL
jgi:ubiquinone/menaquinone biosynthesis C-methylase UbiE